MLQNNAMWKNIVSCFTFQPKEKIRSINRLKRILNYASILLPVYCLSKNTEVFEIIELSKTETRKSEGHFYTHLSVCDIEQIVVMDRR